MQTVDSIYYPLGFISPCLLTGKVIYQNVCDLKVPWNKEISRENQNEWLKWTRDLHKVTMISYIDIHLFIDASLTGVCTIAYMQS